MEPPLPSFAHDGYRNRSRQDGSSSYTLRNIYKAGYLQIDFDAYEVFLDGRKIHVSLRQFEILRFLVKFPNRVFTRTQILESVWGRTGRSIGARTIDQQIRRLRVRIEHDHTHPDVIVTVRGVGYKFD